MESIDWSKFYADMKRSPVNIYMNQKTYKQLREKDAELLSLNIKINNHLRGNEALLVEKQGKIITLNFYKKKTGQEDKK